MSKFNSSYFKHSSNNIVIQTKLSQKELKKQNKLQKSNNTNITDTDFNKLMNEDNVKQKKTCVKLMDYVTFYKQSNIELVNSLINENLLGEELLLKIKSCNKYCDIKGYELLNGIIKKYNNVDESDWIENKKYGLALQFLLENKLEEQLICLIILQNYSSEYNFTKVIYKNKSVYHINWIFQLFFIHEIIDESVYWKWQEIIFDAVDISSDIKNKICIQTTDFFNILKMTFTNQDYENDEIDNKIKSNFNNKNCNMENLNIQQKKSYVYSDNESKHNYDVPEEQDYNMDNDNFNIDDL